ncbi:hypothetical protein RFI_14004 [Reticulomyxa filosa]|uniref:Uncharacterized protein n=1 Tax=Reticulomyxa filosa TaxID=46433 RepID=X6NCX3_RETFI|nr:hypothetical protein RFI_14004 [Reticulomyxa filosa]|eukprot:ETO23177.1 hypothetical protein RFI_14004 [Reticulomyxa filosa]
MELDHSSKKMQEEASPSKLQQRWQMLELYVRQSTYRHKPRAVFLSMYHFYQAYRGMEFDTLYYCVCIFICKREWVFPQSGLLSEDEPGSYDSHSSSCKLPRGHWMWHVPFDSEFVEVVRYKERLKFTFFFFFFLSFAFFSALFCPFFFFFCLLNFFNKKCLTMRNKKKRGGIIAKKKSQIIWVDPSPDFEKVEKSTVDIRWTLISEQLQKLKDYVTDTYYHPLILKAEMFKDELDLSCDFAEIRAEVFLN